ncbi:cellulose synthase/poly-beta-1,6-N-acetylglucosamine synthase-like glycosyltransferase [Microbacterium sp. AG790]|uniref:glycosyltransferase family 2 protein n=1 Tax=Microbacterium sp. AG790 TaxID=2183995 RepID=UPI000F129329|nr:glycosyltransferase family 2 protein [Microbacterium sp. AG790]RKS86707.1 cellulose synthase/poly-beta-1,6-N-acetylglucosamine synthase-like glycosyltransferase [Microbacterium sp. AG790]
MQIVLAVSMQLSLILSVIFTLYVLLIVVPFLRRRSRRSGEPGDLEWHLFVPCRDEQAVIGETLEYLLGSFPDTHVWVIDDDSDDDTAVIVAGWMQASPLVHLVQRRRPKARTGKGDALNAAYAELIAWLGDGVDAERVIVGVVDADGRPAVGCLRAVAGPDYFGDSSVGGVQIVVRMMNRDVHTPLPSSGRLRNFFARTLVRMQDVEFRTVISAIQSARIYTGTVGMGGNGQFTRLSALQSLDGGDGKAWRGSLLEDFELGVHLLLAGWKNRFCPDTWVDQEALFDLRRYLTQRTRWGQGVMQCIRYWPAVWSSRKISNAGIVEMTYYFLQPWLTLIGTFVYPIPMIFLATALLSNTEFLVDFLTRGGAALLGTYLVAGLAPFFLWGPVYIAKCERKQGYWRGVGWGWAYVLYVYAFYVTTWRAFGRLLTGRSGWAKTRRNSEAAIGQPVARES